MSWETEISLLLNQMNFQIKAHFQKGRESQTSQFRCLLDGKFIC